MKIPPSPPILGGSGQGGRRIFTVEVVVDIALAHPPRRIGAGVQNSLIYLSVFTVITEKAFFCDFFINSSVLDLSKSIRNAHPLIGNSSLPPLILAFSWMQANATNSYLTSRS